MSRAHPKASGANAAPPSGARRPPRPADRRAVLRFLLVFAGGWATALVLLAFAPGIERWAVRHTIGSLMLVTRLFHSQCQTFGDSVSLFGVSMQIVPDCTPLMPTTALWIAIAAFPGAWRRKLAGVAVGALLLWLYNLLRILALVPVLAHRPQLFEFIHVYLWQTVTLLVVFGLFLLWLRFQSRRAAPA